MDGLRRVKVSLRVAGGIPREELARSGERLGPLEVLRTESGLATGVVVLLDVCVPTQVLDRAEPLRGTEDLEAIVAAVEIVKCEVDKRGWKIDGLLASLEAR